MFRHLLLAGLSAGLGIGVTLSYQAVFHTQIQHVQQVTQTCPEPPRPDVFQPTDTTYQARGQLHTLPVLGGQP